jgi:glycosyltransferase involved in cell wall biosynthesis
VEVLSLRSEEVAPVYGRAWVCVLPSVDEAFGLTLAESLACGTPVVGSDHGAIPEIVTSDSVGRLFKGDEPASLASALLEGLELAEDPHTSAACRKHAERFSTEAFVESYESLYRDLLTCGR